MSTRGFRLDARRLLRRYSSLVPPCRPGSRSAWSLWLALASAGLGCGEPPTAPREPPCEAPICVADPVPHLVCPDACERHDDCPQGTICSPTPEGPASMCTPPRGPLTPSTALIEGFGVPPMEGTLVTVALPVQDGRVVTSTELSWRAPASATVVTCALLACPPVVEGGTIVNYDQCAVARVVSAQAVGTFGLDDPERELPVPDTATCADGSTPADDQDTHGRFPITELLVGCWAYDDTRLVAATRLRRPAAATIHDFHDAFDLDCQGPTAEGRTCVLGDGTMGSCWDGACHRRCLRDADCGEQGQPAAEGACDGSRRVGPLSLCVDPGPTRPVEDF